jgi:ribosome-associated protein
VTGDPTEVAPGADDEAPSLTLSSALKLAGFAATGGQAKRRIQAGEVQVNGRVETRRKARLRPGDEITVGDETFVLELAEDAPEDASGGDGAG